ncbi:MAG: hypothetical protein Kow0077_21390 [Anaerolineae bacterium]
MTQKRMSIKEIRETSRALEASLKSTARGLDLLLQSLERGGFKAAVAPYQQLQQVLLQQRLWSVDYGREVLNPLWKEISRKAAAIHAILAPFSAAMAEIKELERITAVGEIVEASTAADESVVGSQVPPPDAVILQIAALLLEGVAVSGVRLARALDLPDEERRARLRALVQMGLLERRGWGRGQSYRLAPAARAYLEHLLQQQLTGAAPSHGDGKPQSTE